MSPEIQRSDPPYMQVVRAIRTRIESGELRDGDLVPSARQITKEWGVSIATATKVLAALRSEGLVEGVQGVGTIVRTGGQRQSAWNRALSVTRTGKIYPPGQHAAIVQAELIPAPQHVADALRLSPGSSVIRRHRTTHRGETVVSISTSWFDGVLAAEAPLLLETERLLEGTFVHLARQTGRVCTSGAEQSAAAAATAQEAAELGVAVGSPVLRSRNWYYDADGNVIEFGESVTGPDLYTPLYHYELTT